MMIDRSVFSRSQSRGCPLPDALDEHTALPHVKQLNRYVGTSFGQVLSKLTYLRDVQPGLVSIRTRKLEIYESLKKWAVLSVENS